VEGFSPRLEEVKGTRIVMKFGGSLVGSTRGPGRIADIVSRSVARTSPVVVVSAMGDVTDLLIEAAEGATTSGPARMAETMASIRNTHAKAVTETSIGAQEKAVLQRRLDRMLESLRTTLAGVNILGELSPRSRDTIISFGERLAAPIVSAEIRSRGIDSADMTGGEAGIITDDSFGDARPDMRATRRAVRRALLKRLPRRQVPVVCGFIARSKHGDITTLGRGGSDNTATIIAEAIDADEVWVWTDVDGIMTGDPRIVSRPKIVPSLSYAEAEELAFFGAKNMHPLALVPARESGIPVRIKNGFRPDAEGTLITSKETKSGGVMKCVAVVKGVGLLTVSGEALQGRPGIAAKVFEALAATKVNVLMISQSVSEANISMVVRRASLKQALRALEEGLAREEIPASVKADPSVAVVAAVGAGMRGTRGVAASVFKAVASKGVNVRMIAQGSSELNISFLVDSSKADTAARALHELVVRRR
jgi:aspartate kinase